MVKKNMSVKDFSKLHEEMRILYLCRWKLDELISGKKKLRTGKFLTLEEAITHKTIVKIDIWAPVNGTYTEVTNVFYLILNDRSGNEIILNKELTDYVESLNGDINKYASVEFRNSLKVAKRMYIKNNLLGNFDMQNKLKMIEDKENQVKKMDDKRNSLSISSITKRMTKFAKILDEDSSSDDSEHSPKIFDMKNIGLDAEVKLSAIEQPHIELSIRDVSNNTQ